jgi:hypothetical protein
LIFKNTRSALISKTPKGMALDLFLVAFGAPGPPPPPPSPRKKLLSFGL